MEGIQNYVATTSTTTQTFLVAIVFGLTAYYVLRKRYRLPPGPYAFPLLGNVLSFRGIPIYQKLAEWRKIYGSVITVYLGPIRCVTLNDTDVILEVLLKKQVDFAGRPQTYSTVELTDGGKSIIFGDYHATWRFHRKLASKALRRYISGDHLEHKLTESLRNFIEAIEKVKGPVNPHKFNSLVAFNILFGVCFGETYSTDDPLFNKMLDLFDEFLSLIGNGPLEDIIPPLRLFPTKLMRRLRQVSDELFTMLDVFIDDHRKTFSEDNLRDFTDSILLAQKEAMDEEDEKVMSQITNEHVRQTVGDIVGAGIDTTRYTLNWALLYMAAYPEIQSKVHAEVDQVLPNDGTIVMEYRNKLTYTNAVIHEVMRLSSVAPLSVPRTAVCDTKIGDYDIPKGTLVLLNMWLIHHDPDKWTEVKKFKPERFLDENGAMAPKPDSWLPFSAGRRVCLGESVAKPELHLLLAGYMRRFKVSLPDGVEPDLKAAEGGFLCRPTPYEILFETRK